MGARHEELIKQEVEKVNLRPEEIVTLNDFPVHSLVELQRYFHMVCNGISLPPVPIVRMEVIEPFLPEKTLNKFREGHPDAKYFLMDGSHRTTAATLTHRTIPTIVIELDRDIKNAERMVEKGELFGLAFSGTFAECLGNMAKHFFEKPWFETVEEKTGRMVKENVIPQDMINSYLEK